MLITTSSILGQNVEVMASNPTNYKDMTEYAAYENVIADAGATSGDFGISLALYDIELVVISKLATIDTLTKFLFFFISIPHFLTRIQFCYLHQIHYIFKMICSSITSPSIFYLFYTQNSINISMFAVSTLYYTFSSSNTQSLKNSARVKPKVWHIISSLSIPVFPKRGYFF